MSAFDPKTSALTLNSDMPEVTRPFQISDLENLYNLLYTCVASNYDILNKNGYDEPAVIAGGEVVENESSVTVGPVVFSFRGKIFVNTTTIEVSAGSSYGLCLVEQNTDNRVFGDGVTRPFASVGLVVAAPESFEAPAGLVKRLGYPYQSQMKIWKSNAWYNKEVPGGSLMTGTVPWSAMVSGGVPNSAIRNNSIGPAKLTADAVTANNTSRYYRRYTLGWSHAYQTEEYEIQDIDNFSISDVAYVGTDGMWATRICKVRVDDLNSTGITLITLTANMTQTTEAPIELPLTIYVPNTNPYRSSLALRLNQYAHIDGRRFVFNQYHEMKLTPNRTCGMIATLTKLRTSVYCITSIQDFVEE